ncbi:MAG: glycosyltransferase [Novosphingobium sp.]
MSVIVPHYNDLERLQSCLAALCAQTLPHDSFEIVVADNSSPVGLSVVEAAVAGRARIVVANERGAGPARNAGVAASRGAILAFTDCDCMPEPGWLEAGIGRLASADVVGGRMVVSVGDETSMSGAEAFERVFAFHNHRYIEEKRFTVTANLFCSRASFDTIGPFLNGVSEDVEWCHRAIAKGCSLVYEPAAVVAHPARVDWPQLKRKWRRVNAETYAMEANGKAGRLRWVARNLAMPFSIVAHAPKVVASPDLPNARARLRALGMLARLRLWRMVDAMRLIRRDR